MIRLSKSGLVRRLFSSYLVKGALAVSSTHSRPADVLVQGGVVAAIGEGLAAPAGCQTIDGSGKLLIPGGIDPHVHMQLPFMGTNAVDDFESGSRSALIGGTTSFIDFAIPNKGESLLAAYERWRSWADGKVHSDYSLHVAITEWNSKVHEEMAEVVKRGVTSFKFFMAYKGALQVDDSGLLGAFERAKQLGAVCMVHAENGDLIQYKQKKLVQAGVLGPQGHFLSRPPYVEADCVHRAVSIAQTVNTPLYVVHVMSKEAADEIARAKSKGLVVFAETLAAVLGTDGAKLWSPDFDQASKYVMSPPLGPDPSTKVELMRLLQAGVLEVVATDNCTFCKQQKRLGQHNFTKIPNGVNGIEDRMSVIWTKGVQTGMLSASQFVEATSTKAAKIFNMYPRKGELAVGSDADLVLWDPQATRTISCKSHNQKVDTNIFEGMRVTGSAAATFSRGKLVWDGSKFIDNRGSGEFVHRKPFGFAFQRIANLDKTNDPRLQAVDRSASQPKATQPQKQQEGEPAKVVFQRQKFYKGKQLINIADVMSRYIPEQELAEVNRILYGGRCTPVPVGEKARELAKAGGFELKSYKIGTLTVEQTRPARWVKVAAIQHSIVRPTTDPVSVQKHAIMDRVKQLIEAAVEAGAKVVGLQQIWNAPFFMCTRQKFPWIQFAEPVEGESTQMLKELSKKHGLVIISSILELDSVREVFHNSAIVIEGGEVLGKQHKNHIPRVGDFNQSTYYMEGLTGHNVFETSQGRIGVNICYGRHHPLNWMAFGLNGAEIVFNPSATVGGLSQHLWGIEARNAAIANHYFAVGINRVGTEHYPNAFTSGDGKPPKNEFGHFYGSSYVSAPDGSRTPGLSRTEDGVVVTQLDLNMCRQVKSHWGFTMTARFQDYAALLARFVQPDYVQQIIRKK